MINISDMFNEDTYQTKTYTIGCECEAYHVEFTRLVEMYGFEMASRVIDAIDQGKRYLTVRQDFLVYQGRLFNDPVIEISWD